MRRTMAQRLEGRRISTLPKWAQNLIHDLLADLASYEDQVQTLLGEHEESHILVHAFGEADFYLPDDRVIRFIPEGSGGVDVTVHDGSIRVSTLHGQLSIVPDASNSIHVRGGY